VYGQQSQVLKWYAEVNVRMGMFWLLSVRNSCNCNYKVNCPYTGLERPWGFQESEALIFQDKLHIKVIRWSFQLNGHLYHLRNISGTHLFQRLRRPQGHSAARRIMVMKNPPPKRKPSGIETTSFQLAAQCLIYYFFIPLFSTALCTEVNLSDSTPLTTVGP
jgi:hypothetical protein